MGSTSSLSRGCSPQIQSQDGPVVQRPKVPVLSAPAACVLAGTPGVLATPHPFDSGPIRGSDGPDQHTGVETM
jgi:hypothetical protein